MNCEETRNYLLDYIDNELPLSLQQQIEEHLAECMHCRKEVDEYKKMGMLLQLRSVPDPGDAYWQQTEDKIMQQVRARTYAMPNASPADGSVAPWQRWRSRTTVFLAAAAAVAIIAMAGLFWLSTERESENYVDNDIEYQLILDDHWQPSVPDFGALPASFQPEVEFSAYSRAALGGIDPISKSAVIRRVEALGK